MNVYSIFKPHRVRYAFESVMCSTPSPLIHQNPHFKGKVMLKAILFHLKSKEKLALLTAKVTRTKHAVGYKTKSPVIYLICLLLHCFNCFSVDCGAYNQLSSVYI